MSTALVTLGELEKMAQVVVGSKLFGVETVEQAMTLMLLCQAENVHPMIALRDYHIVEGKPALKADAMLARFQAGGGKVEWQEYTDTKVSAYFSHPGSPKPVLIEWSLESAAKVSVWSKKKGGWEPLTNKHTWKSYPRQMLKARVISEGVRATNPGVAVGIYTVEETQDFIEPRQEKNITPSAGVEEQLTIEEATRVGEVMRKMRDWIEQGSLGDAVYEMENAALNAEQQIVLWTYFDSKQRSAMKKEQARMKAEAAKKALPPPTLDTGGMDIISPAAHKRLEARISELKLDREAVKKYVKDTFGRDHFTEMTKEEYDKLDKTIEIRAAAKERKDKARPARDGGWTMSEEGMITRRGPLDMQVCVPSNWDDQRVKEFADRRNECGTEHGWSIRKAGNKLLAGAEERVACTERAGCVHIMLDA